MRRSLAAACACAAALAGAGRAHADSPANDPSPTSISYDYSPYEREAIDAVALELGSQVDPAPEGKLIERVRIVTLEVVERRDPAPQLLNVLHTTTRAYVVERELLLREGDRYKKVLVDETARNLRGASQLSVVLCVPLRGSRPDRVVLAVITKDVWSLRLNWDVSYSNGGLEQLVLNPSETNVAGTHQIIATRLELQPASLAAGVSYTVPRLTPHRMTAQAAVNVIFNRASGDPEGSFGSFTLERPLLTSRTQWSWSFDNAWRYEVTRRYINAQVARFDALSTPEADNIPYEYLSQRRVHGLGLTRSFGWALKHDATVGARWDVRAYDMPDLPNAAPIAVQEFRSRRVPTSDTRVGPFVQYRTYTTNYVRVLDFETLGLQEDFRLGHDLILRAYPVLKPLGSSRSFLGTFAAAQYSVPLSDGLARGAVESIMEGDAEQISDGSITGALRVMTPRLGFGRLVSDTTVLYRYRNFLNRTTMLGGSTRLRGYPTNYDEGQHALAHNLEMRSRPVEILSCQLGGVAFYDVGDAVDDWQRMRIKHSVGVGLRALFPQLDRIVFRADVGMPVVRGRLPPGVAPIGVYVAFGQAFGVPAITPP